MKKYLILSISFVFLSACASKQSFETTEFYEKDTTKIEVAESTEKILGKEGSLKIKDRVFFTFDSINLSSDAKFELDNVIFWLQGESEITITVEGHTDERGTREYNIALGQRRANTVKNYLVRIGKINKNRIKVISYGKEKPEVLGNNQRAWSQNRRAVITVNKK